MEQLADEYLERHAIPKKRPQSVRNDRGLIANYVRPRLGTRKVENVSRRDNTESEAAPTLIWPTSRSKPRQLPCADVVASLGSLAPFRIAQSFARGSVD